jgi:hypothetical protein
MLEMICIRNNLSNKRIPQTESVEGNIEVEKVSELIWLDDDSFESEDFILVESRKKQRQNKNSIKISPGIEKKKNVQEELGMMKKRGRSPSTAFPSKSKKSKKKS